MTFFLILVLLDLSAAFDTVTVTASSYIIWRFVQASRALLLAYYTHTSRNRTFSVTLGNSSSLTAKLNCGIPHDSVLGLLFSIYMLPLAKVVQNHDVLYQFYADDTQFYMPLKPTDHRSLANLVTCLFQVKPLMSQNVLKFNDDKSEVILFCPSKSFSYFGVNLGDLSNNVRQAVRRLWVIFDASLCFDDEVFTVMFPPAQANL